MVKIKKKNLKYVYGAGIILIILIGYLVFKPSPGYDAFAQCLTGKGVVMYGSAYCGHCKNQKEMFGDSFKYINYVECSKEREKCAGIQGVPTWQFEDGTKKAGVQSLAQLSALSGCKI